MKHTKSHSVILGSILIEVIIASAVAVMGLFTVYLGFVQAVRSNQRNDLQSIALTVISSQINLDSTVPFATLNDTTPALTAPASIPGSTFQRTVTTEDINTDGTPDIKKVHYNLSWATSTIPQTVSVDYQMADHGLNND